jgi:raffinose/stachyose/melibiose transport system substrate-binding protein
MKVRRTYAGMATAALVVALAGCGTITGGGSGGDDDGDTVTLKMESWRQEDSVAWEKIIAAFEEDHPDIKVEFDPTSPTEYDAALRTRLEGGVAGDLIFCRAFDASQALYQDKLLSSLDDVDGLENYSENVLSAWQTDDHKTTFCVPMGGSIHGFLYNTEAFAKLGLEPPTTAAEFLDVLKAIKDDGSYEPLAMGTADVWTVGEMGYYNIGPNYWRGEEGRQGLIDGTKKFTDPEFVAPFAALKEWAPYLPEDSEGVTYPDAQQLFTSGRAAIFPAGSWEIAGFNDQADFKMGFFKAPLPEPSQDTCYTNFHTDSGLGMNAATKHPEQVKTFLDWVTTTDFAETFGNALPGQIPLNSTPVELTDPTAKEFETATTDCDTTIRLAYQYLDRGDPNTTLNIYDQAVAVMRGDETPEQAAAKVQEGLDSWYKPPTS